MNDNLPPESADQPDPQLEAILKFTPAPRKYKRANAWTPALQRRFIALLAETGSPARACEAMGKDRYGVEKVYKSEGAEGFRAAWDAAIALFEERDAERQAEERGQWAGVRPPAGVDHRTPGPAPSRRREEPEPEDDDLFGMDEDEKLGMLENLVYKFLRKVKAEREARLAGEVVAADFYLRQVTFLEVAFDMMSEGLGLDGWQILGDLRRGGHHVTEIAETPMSRSLDDKRRELWRAMSEPERPDHPPERYLSVRDGCSIEPLENMRGGDDEEREEQRAEYAAQHAEDAARQAEWERGAQAEGDDQ